MTGLLAAATLIQAASSPPLFADDAPYQTLAWCSGNLSGRIEAGTRLLPRARFPQDVRTRLESAGRDLKGFEALLVHARAVASAEEVAGAEAARASALSDWSASLRLLPAEIWIRWYDHDDRSADCAAAAAALGEAPEAPVAD